MPDSPSPETLAWLRHAASCGKADAQLTLHILERLEALERRPIPGAVELAAPTPEPAPVARPEGDWFAVATVGGGMRSRGLAEQIAGDELLKLANCQPPAAPVASDQELADCYADAARVAILNCRVYDKALTPGEMLKAQIRACYDLGRKHGAAQPAPMQRLIDAPMDARGYADLREPAPSAAPAGWLVEEICRQLPLRPVEARAVIRAVAAWIRSKLNGRSVADRLEQEADR